MGTREEFERQCPFCGKGMRERAAYQSYDDYIIKEFKCRKLRSSCMCFQPKTRLQAS